MLIFSAGCSKSFDDLADFERYVKGPDYPYLQSVTKKDVTVHARFMPTEAMMVNDYRNYLQQSEYVGTSGNSGVFNQDSMLQILRDARQGYDRSIYFFVTIGYTDPNKDLEYYHLQTQGFPAYSAWMQKLLFGLSEYMTLQTAEVEEIPLNSYYMERTFGMIKSRTFILMFPREFNDQDLLQSSGLTLRIKEFGLNTGNLSFEYPLPVKDLRYTGINELN